MRLENIEGKVPDSGCIQLLSLKLTLIPPLSSKGPIHMYVFYKRISNHEYGGQGIGLYFSLAMYYNM